MTAIISGNEYFTNSGLLLKFGTTKAIPTNWSEYCMPGPNRIIEGYVDLTQLAAFGNTTILGDVEFFPAPPAGSSNTQLIIEKVEAYVIQGATGTGATFSLGLISSKDRSTIPTNYGTALINADTQSNYANVGTLITYVHGTSGVGGLIGSQPNTTDGPFLLTGLAGTANFTAGQLLVRIYYHGFGTITQ